MENKKKIINFRALPIALALAIAEILLVSLLGFVYGIVGLIVLLAITICAFAIKKYRSKAWYLLMFLIISIGIVTQSGVKCAKIQQDKPMIFNASLTGVVHSDSELEPNALGGIEIVLNKIIYGSNVAQGKEDGKAYFMYYGSDAKDIKVGDVLSVSCVMRPLRVVFKDMPSVIRYLNGYRYELSEVILNSGEHKPPSMLEGIRVSSKNALLSIKGGEIIYAMMYGDKDYLAYDFLDASRFIGIAHIFAVSGLHLGLVAGVISWLCKKCKANKWIDYIVVLLFSLFYAIMVGMSVSVMRALLMLVVYKTNKLLGYRYSAINSLSLSCIIILLINPISLYSISLQLSVFAMIGLIFFSKPLEKKIKTKWKKFNSLLAQTLSINFALLPIMMYYFGRVSLLFLPANLIIIPLISLIFPFVFIFAIFTPLLSQITYVLIPFGYVFKGIEYLTIFIAKIPFPKISFSLSIVDLILWIILLVLLSSFVMYHKKAKAIFTAVTCVVIVGVAVIPSFGRLDGSAKINTIVSSNDCQYFMVDIKNKHYLFVNGDLSNAYMSKSVKYMNENSIYKIDGLVKADINDGDAELLLNFKRNLEINELITFSKHPMAKTVFEDKVYYNRIVGNFMITPYSENEILLKDKNATALFVNGNKNDIFTYSYSTVDILFGTTSTYLYENIMQIMPKYFVNDNAVAKDITYSINSYFTFIIKNDTIKVI